MAGYSRGPVYPLWVHRGQHSAGHGATRLTCRVPYAALSLRPTELNISGTATYRKGKRDIP